MPFPHEVSTDLREWINRQGTAVQKEWLRMHDAAKPRGLRERLFPEEHNARLEREGLSAWQRKRSERK